LRNIRIEPGKVRAGERIGMAMEIDGDDLTRKLGGFRKKGLVAQ
jgi:hypothetical protein